MTGIDAEAVDLSRAEGGGVAFYRNGLKIWTCITEEKGKFWVRIESGWYEPHSRDGVCLGAGRIVHSNGREEPFPPAAGFDIVRFVPCRWDSAVRRACLDERDKNIRRGP